MGNFLPDPMTEIAIGGVTYRVGARVRIRSSPDAAGETAMPEGRIRAIHPVDGRTFFSVVLDSRDGSEAAELYVAPSEIELLD